MGEYNERVVKLVYSTFTNGFLIFFVSRFYVFLSYFTLISTFLHICQQAVFI